MLRKGSVAMGAGVSEGTGRLVVPEKVEMISKPFHVDTEDSLRASFKVLECPVYLKQSLGNILQALPMHFSARKIEDVDWSYSEDGGPVEVYLLDRNFQIISLYPKAGYTFRDVSFQAWKFHELIQKMYVDALMLDVERGSGSGQMRSCVHFDPAILGVAWPCKEVEVDIFKYPKGHNRK